MTYSVSIYTEQVGDCLLRYPVVHLWQRQNIAARSSLIYTRRSVQIMLSSCLWFVRA